MYRRRRRWRSGPRKVVRSLDDRRRGLRARALERGLLFVGHQTKSRFGAPMPTRPLQLDFVTREKVAQPFIVWNIACGISLATFTQSRRRDAATRVRVWIGGFEALGANASVADGSKKTQEWRRSVNRPHSRGASCTGSVRVPSFPRGTKSAPRCARRITRRIGPASQPSVSTYRRQPDGHHDQPRRCHPRLPPRPPARRRYGGPWMVNYLQSELCSRSVAVGLRANQCGAKFWPQAISVAPIGPILG